MSHITLEKRRLTGRINRLIGQLEGIRGMVGDAAEGDDRDCYRIMQQFAAVRGALNGLMQDLIEQHIEHHVIDRESANARREGGRELLRVLRSFTR